MSTNLKPWEVTGSRYVVEDRWMRLRADDCRTASGVVVAPYYVQESADWVHVAAFDEEKRLLVTRQYRHGTGKISTELPCGVMEEGEKPEGDDQPSDLKDTWSLTSDLLIRYHNVPRTTLYVP